jgi:GxxExxY protein
MNDILKTVILNAAREVYDVLGQGHSEATYEEALKHELSLQHEFVKTVISEVTFPILYKGIPVGYQRADIIVRFQSGENWVLELKAIQNINPTISNQVRRYLDQFQIFSLSKGVILNFGPTMQTVWVE